MLSQLHFNTAARLNFGEATLYSGEGILGHNKVIDFFLNFWLCLEIPRRKDINPAKLKEFIDHVVLLDVEKKPQGFALNTRLIGTFVVSHYGEISGKDIAEMKNKQAVERIYSVCKKLLKAPQPFLTITPGFDQKRNYLEAFALYLPLYDDDLNVEKVMVAVDVVSSTKNK